MTTGQEKFEYLYSIVEGDAEEMFDQFRLCDNKTDPLEQVCSAFDIQCGYRKLNIAAKQQTNANKDPVELSISVLELLLTDLTQCQKRKSYVM